MELDEARARIQEIQGVMERATRYPRLPGAAAVGAGLLVLLGCGVSVALFRTAGAAGARALDFASLMDLPLGRQLAFGAMWLLVLAGGIALEAIHAGRAARRQGAPALTRPARLAVYSLTPSVVVALVLSARLLGAADWRPDDVRLVVPIWMMLYGTGVYTAGLFSVRLPRVLGIAFIALGAVALLAFPRYGVVAGALSFGLLHVAFGVAVMRRSRQDGAA
jgi:hypothetical protein